MGNACCGEGHSQIDDEQHKPRSLKSNMVQDTRHREVFKSYVVTRVLGEGSMGSVSCVRRKESSGGASCHSDRRKSSTKGGLFSSANRSRQKDLASSPTKEKPPAKEYALKSIIVSRVSVRTLTIHVCSLNPVMTTFQFSSIVSAFVPKRRIHHSAQNEFLDELRNEISILKGLDHPNIIRAYEIYETRRNIYIVMELCSGGDLYARNPYSEKEAAKIVGKLLSAIAYLHAQNITHRDIKYENIMFENKFKDAEIKLIDFGLSKKFSPEDPCMTDGVGTIYTMAPQVLQGVYTSQADVWSVGVIAYMLLSSTKPFDHKKRRFLIDQIMRCDYNFDDVVWDHVSKEAKKFVSALIKMDPEERLTAEQASKHTWLSKEFPLSDRRPDEQFMKDVNSNLMNYGKIGEFKKMALMVIAHKSTSAEIVDLRKAFNQFDTENDGTITLDEFKRALEKFNYSEEVVDAMFKNVDVDRNGQIHYTEFLAATLEAHGRIEEERLAEAFDRIDSDGTGYISRKNLKDLLGSDYTKKLVDTFLEEADFNKDGKISFDEFLRAFQQNTKSLKQIVGANPPSDTEDNATLVGTDAVIPGGKHDTASKK